MSVLVTDLCIMFETRKIQVFFECNLLLDFVEILIFWIFSFQSSKYHKNQKSPNLNHHNNIFFLQIFRLQWRIKVRMKVATKCYSFSRYFTNIIHHFFKVIWSICSFFSCVGILYAKQYKILLICFNIKEKKVVIFINFCIPVFTSKFYNGIIDIDIIIIRNIK